jgi:formylglycine-generating enzyme required for sulfatase activity
LTPERINTLLTGLPAEPEMKPKLTEEELAVWRRALVVSAQAHQAAMNLRKRELGLQPVLDKVRPRLQVELRQMFYKFYDDTGGALPVLLPLIDDMVRDLREQWEWIKIPEGYRLHKVEEDHYSLISKEVFSRKLMGLDPNVEVKNTGFGTYTIRRKPVPKVSITPGAEKVEPKQPEPGPQTRRMGGIEWARIPAGKFVMGSRADNPLAYDDERPQHTVELTYDFQIARYPVTNAEFEKFVTATGYSSRAVRPDRPDHPVVNVTWDDAQAYCKWLTKQLRAEGVLENNEVVRLPTEAEWEKAARGEYGREWPWGDEWDPAKCNNAETGPKTTTPVGQYSPHGDSPYGVADMVGNVWEWCADWWQVNLYQSRAGQVVRDPQGPAKGSARVVRGGSFLYGRRLCRAPSRDWPAAFDDDIGCRVARSP